MRKVIGLIVFFMNVLLAFSFESDLRKLIEKASKSAYPNAHEVLLKRVEDIEYLYDGNYTSIKEEYLKILDQVGKEENKLIFTSYNSSYEENKFLEIKLIRNDKIIDFDFEKNMKVQDSPAGQESNIYDENKKLIVVNIPDLQIGDVLYIKEFEKSKKTRMPGNYTDYIAGQELYPILYSKTKITGPKNKPFKTSRVYNKIEGKYSLDTGIAGEKRWYSFTVADVPQINPEPQMPSIVEIAMKWAVTTISSWDEVSKWYYQLSEPKIVVDEKILSAAREITKEYETDMDKIRAVFFWVSRNVRYMGINIEKNRPGLEPHRSDYTLGNMTGVCRDKAALIVAMLRGLGYEANMVLMNASRKMEPDFPNSFFNHAIASVIINGEVVIMDPTDETTKTLIPEYLAGKPYLIAKKSGDTLMFNDVLNPDLNKLEIKSVVSPVDGEFLVRSSLEFQGINDNVYRRYLIGLKQDERKKFFESLLRNISQNTKLISFNISPENLLEEKELKIELKYSIGDFIVGDEYRMFRLPQLSESFGMHNWILRGFNLSERNYPLLIDSTVSLKEEVSMKMDGVEFLNIPKKIEENKEPHSYYGNYTLDRNELIFQKKLSLKKIEYSQKDYTEIRELMGEMENYSKKYIIVKKR